MTAISTKPTHGKVLRFLLIGLIVIHLLMVGLMIINLLTPDPSFADTQTTLLMLLAQVTTVAALVSIWFWRKVGFQVLIVVSILEAGLWLAIYHSVLSVPGPVAEMLVVWTIIQHPWQYFH